MEEMDTGLQGEISVATNVIEMSSEASDPFPAGVVVECSGKDTGRKRRKIFDEESLLESIEECKRDKDGKGFKQLIKTLQKIPYDQTQLVVVDRWIIRILNLFKEIGSSNSDVKSLCKKCITWANLNSRTSIRQVLELHLMECFYTAGNFEAALQLGQVLQKELPTDLARDFLIQVSLFESKIYLALKDTPRATNALRTAQLQAIQAYCPPAIQERLSRQAVSVGLLPATEDNDVTKVQMNSIAQSKSSSSTRVNDLEEHESPATLKIEYTFEDSPVAVDEDSNTTQILPNTVNDEEGSLPIENTDNSSNGTSIEKENRDCAITVPNVGIDQEVDVLIQNQKEYSPITTLTVKTGKDVDAEIQNQKKDCPITTPTVEEDEDIDISMQNQQEDFSITITVDSNSRTSTLKSTVPSDPSTSFANVYKCPKLKMRTTVPIVRLSVEKLKKLKETPGGIKVNELVLLDTFFAKLSKYNPIKKKTTISTKKKRDCTTSNGGMVESSDSDNIVLLSDCSEDDNITDKIFANEQQRSAKNALTVFEDSKNFSDMEDMSTVSDEESQVKENRGMRLRSSRPVPMSKQKQYKTPLTKDNLSSDDSSSKVKKNTKTKRGTVKAKQEKKDMEFADTKTKKLKEAQKFSKNNEESMSRTKANHSKLNGDDDSVGISDESDKDQKQGSKTSDETDSDFTGYRKILDVKNKKKEKLRKVKGVIRDETSDDSDFVPDKKKLSSKPSQKGSKNDSAKEESSKEESGDSSDSDSPPQKALRSHKKRNLSTSESDSATKTAKGNKKRRRVIKTENFSGNSDNSDVMILDSDIEITESSPKKKSIRKVMGKNELLKTTRQAAKEEEERKKRVADKQKLFNQVFIVETNKGAKATEVILDFDKETKTPLLSVDSTIVKSLKPHQVAGIKFMWNTCYESMKKVKTSKGGGCILAHCMGLGKTLQTIAFLHTVMSSQECDTKCALVICPLNTVGNWYNEFRQWCSDCNVHPRIHRLWDLKGKQRIEALEDWNRLGGVGIMHYDAFRTLANSNEKKKNRPSQKELKIIETCLLTPGPDIVICDEGHLLKNAKAQQAKAVMKISTQRRVVLTGTPLQNNLVEYHTMMSFVKPNLLGTKKEFMNRFVNPIAHGQHKDSGEQDVRLMKRRAHVLHKLLDGCVQRLDYSVLTPYLPPKFEYAISINLSKVQKDLYAYYLANLTSNAVGGTFQSSQLFKDYQGLVKIWTHPIVLTFKRKEVEATTDSVGSIKDFIDDDTSDTDDGDSGSEGNKNEVVSKRKTRSSKGIIDEKPNSPPPFESSAWYSSFFKSRKEMEALEMSGKMIVLFEILKICEEIGDKVLVFSQFLTSLDLIEDFLADRDAEAKKESTREPVFPPSASDSIGRWRPNVEYFRIDGSTRSYDRQKSCDIFNKSKATRAKLFLISTKAGGLGINLTGANRVVIFDASWNPSHDLQSIFRVFRFGQLKPCYVYRLLARGTMEERIYNRQVVKLSLSCRVVDEQQIERHFQFDEIQDMYKFNANDQVERPIPAVPKDRLLAELLISHKEWVFSYLEHDSLLENKEEEELTEAERKAAWEEYENEDRHTNKPMIGFDEWTKFIMEKLQLRFPDKGTAEIYRLSQWTRNEIENMRLVYRQLNSTTSFEEQVLLQQSLRQKTSMLKSVYGDDVDWNGIWKAHVDAKKSKDANKVLNAIPKTTPDRRTQEVVKQKLQQRILTTTSGFPVNYDLPSTSRMAQAQMAAVQQLETQRSMNEGMPPLIPRIMQKPHGSILQNHLRPLSAMKYPIMDNIPRVIGTDSFARPQARKDNESSYIIPGAVDELIVPDIVDLVE